MPRSKTTPRRLDEAGRAALSTLGPIEAPKTLDMVRQERDGLLQNVLGDANDALAQRRAAAPSSPRGGGSKKRTVRLSKKPLKVKSLPKRRSRQRKRSPPPVACPKGCVPAATCKAAGTKGQNMEAAMLQKLEGRAAALDRAPVTVLNPLTGEFEPLGGGGGAAPKAAGARKAPPASPRAPSEAMPSALREYTLARQAAEARGDASFVHNGATYLRAETGGWARQGGPAASPCRKFRDDPTACDAAPGCKYAMGAKKSYCTARHASKGGAPPIGTPGARPVAMAVPLAGRAPPAGAPLATQVTPLGPVPFAGAAPIGA